MADIRPARLADLPAVIALLGDDPLGRTRETLSMPPAPEYVAAFDALDGNPNHVFAVATEGEAVVGTLTLSFLPGFARRGAWRGQIEAVRVARDHRGRGLGLEMFEWAIARCRERGCSLVQLTSDKTRDGAHVFYDRLGFVASHEGYKLAL